MVITIACDVLGKENNGTTIAAYNLIRSLKAKGHEVRVVCPDRDKVGKEGFYVLPAYDFGHFLNEYVAKNGVVIARADENVLSDAISTSDVVHIITPFTVGIYASKIAKKYNKPLTAGFHCQAENLTNHLFMMNFGLANHAAYKLFYTLVYRHCVCIHYPTQFICDVFESEVGPTPHYVISNGVQKAFRKTPSVRPPELESKSVILFTGRFSKEKSHKVLIDAVALSDRRRDIQLIFAGSGPQRENLEKYGREKLEHPPILHFYSREDLIRVINYVDLYVHPAEIEIEAIACLEAIACGKVPLIADSPRSATRYFALTDRNLFRYNDPQDLADRMDWWLEHPEERLSCSKSYLGYAAQFDFTSCMDQMEKMILDVSEARHES